MFTKNKGLTLLEMLLVLGIMVSISIQQFEERMLKAQQAMARNLGTELFQYSNGVRKYIADNYSTEIIALGTGGTSARNGTGWLRSNACGGGSAPQNYVPCNMGDTTTAGKIPLNTVLRESSGTLIAQADYGPITVEGEPRHDLAALAALTAAGGTLNNGLPSGASATASFSTDPTGAAIPFGVIRITIDQNGADDAWLRVDGTNQMQSNITFNPGNAAAFRGLVNLSAIRNTNADIANDQIDFSSAISFVGPNTATQRINGVDQINNNGGGIDIVDYIYDSNSDLIINDNLGIYGYLYDVNSSVLDIRDSVLIRGNADIQANSYTRGYDYTYGRKYNYSNSYTYGTDVSYGYKENRNRVYNYSYNYNYQDTYFYDHTRNYANSYNYNYMYVGNYLYVANHLYTTVMYDRNDSNYYVDPNGTSRVNGLIVNSLYASRYYDADNTNYYADPNGYSMMYGVQTTYIHGGPANWNYVGIYENYLGFYPNGYYSQYWQGYVNADNLWIETIDYRGYRTSNRDRLSYLLPRYVNKGMFRVRSGDYVEKPRCPYGSPRVLVTPATVPIYTVSPNCYFRWSPTGNIGYNPLSYVSSACYMGRSELRSYAYSSGSYWRVYSFSTPFYVHGYAMVTTYCQMY